MKIKTKIKNLTIIKTKLNKFLKYIKQNIIKLIFLTNLNQINSKNKNIKQNQYFTYLKNLK